MLVDATLADALEVLGPILNMPLQVGRGETNRHPKYPSAPLLFVHGGQVPPRNLHDGYCDQGI